MAKKKKFEKGSFVGKREQRPNGTPDPIDYFFRFRKNERKGEGKIMELHRFEMIWASRWGDGDNISLFDM